VTWNPMFIKDSGVFCIQFQDLLTSLSPWNYNIDFQLSSEKWQVIGCWDLVGAVRWLFQLMTCSKIVGRDKRPLYLLRLYYIYGTLQMLCYLIISIIL
jgi:hypothetical protein